MTHPLGVAVVGLGLAGSVMIEAIKHHPGTRLAAAVDPNPKLRSAFETGESLPAFATLEEALGSSSVEVVYVASPHEFHATQAVLAANAGRHVVVEKPMALSLIDCDAMVDAAQRADKVLIVGHTHGFDPAVARAAAIVDSGVYGEVAHLALLNYTNFLYRPRTAADLDPSRGAGVVLNQVAHQIDIARTIVDRQVTSVRALTTRLDARRPIDGSCTALVEFTGGVAASIVYSGYDHFDSDEYQGWITESGREGAPRHGRARAQLARLDGPEAQARSTLLGYGATVPEPSKSQPHFGEVLVSCARADLRITAHGLVAYTGDGVVVETPETTHPWPGHRAVLDELLAAVHSGQSPRHDGRFGRDTIEVCSAMLASAGSGRVVALNSTGVEA